MLFTSSTNPRRANSAATFGKSLRSSFGSSTLVLPYGSMILAPRLRAVPRPPRRQRLAYLDLQAPRRGYVVPPLRHGVGKIALARGVRIGFVVRIPIALAVADFLHQPRRSVAQVQRNFEGAETRRIGLRRTERRIDRIALRRACHEQDG